MLDGPGRGVAQHLMLSGGAFERRERRAVGYDEFSEHCLRPEIGKADTKIPSFDDVDHEHQSSDLIAADRSQTGLYFFHDGLSLTMCRSGIERICFAVAFDCVG